jgi:hypothetical protein
MAVVRAVRALRYDVARVGDLSRVIAPPYDVILPEEQEALYERSPHNVIRLILPREKARAESREDAPECRPASRARPGRPPSTSRRSRCRTADEDARSVLLSPALRSSARCRAPHEKTLPGPG